MIQIGQKASPTFEQPLELLADCHRRVESFLHALVLVTEQAHGGELNRLQREGLETALRYFREAAPKHTADEEESLFPRMRQLGDQAVAAALAKIDALESDHKVAGEDHKLVEELGQKWLATGRLTNGETEQLTRTLQQLENIYEGHIATEEQEIFPLAARCVPRSQLAEVGREMAGRRGQKQSKQL